MKKQEEGEMPGDVCSLFSSSCPFTAKAVVSVLELCPEVLSARQKIWLEEEETQWKGG